MTTTGASALELRHLSLGVNDTERSEAFYRDVLGLPTQHLGDDIHVRWDGFLLVLQKSPPSDRAKFHFGFRVDRPEAVDAWAERLRAAQIEIMSGPFQTGSLRQLFFVDPDNYRIEIYAEG